MMGLRGDLNKSTLRNGNPELSDFNFEFYEFDLKKISSNVLPHVTLVLRMWEAMILF